MINVEMGGSMAEQISKMANQDAFEESSGPIIYMADNRMPAVVEFRSTFIYIIYLALIVVLLLILPGVRRTKLRSFVCLLTLLTAGASILLALNGSHLLTGRVTIQQLKYSALQPDETISGQLEVNIGFNSVNVSLSGLLDSTPDKSIPASENDSSKYVMYNERFSWTDPEGMIKEHRSALSRGLPYPILTVSEYLSHDADGFNWSRRLREAGHFASIILSAALLCWMLTAVSMCLIPSLLGMLMLSTGILMMASTGVYSMLIPSMDSLAIRMMGGQVIEFEWGFDYMATQVVGSMTFLVGLVVFVLQEHSDPGQQFTIMESEQNALDRKTLYGQMMMNIKQHTCLPIESKPDTFKLVIGGEKPTRNDATSNASYTTSTNHSVIIPIGDIEQNFRPTKI